MRCRWLILAGVLPMAGAMAEEPRWEFGFGTALLNVPNYRGSTDRTTYFLPFPYIVYNGDRLKVDREGVRNDFFHSDRLTLDFSLAAGTPARSGDSAREGMPDLDPAFEIGPALRIDLDEDTPGKGGWAVVLPVRAVVATDLRHSQSLGWVFSPYLQYVNTSLAPGWQLNVSGGPMYASERYHDYYYQVDPRFATLRRPAFDASGGYSGSRVTITLSKRYRRYWIGGFVRYDDLSGAAFDDSPLVHTDHSLMFGLGFAWVYSRSADTVPEPQAP